MPKITSDQFVEWDWTDRGGGDTVGFPELEALNAMVDRFAEKMKAKLQKKFMEGYTGWDDPDLKPVIEEKLREHVKRGNDQMVDVANLAAMLWNLEND